MLRVIADCYPDSVSKEDLGEQSGFSSNSGTFGTYLAILKRNGLMRLFLSGLSRRSPAASRPRAGPR